MASRRGDKSRRKRRGQQRFSRVRRARLELHRAEIAKGSDGFLRGSPEPVFMVAVYRAPGRAPFAPTLVARQLWRLRVHKPFPTTAEIIGTEPFTMMPLEPETDARVMLVGVGLEQDSGRDVQRIFAALTELDELRLWRGRDVEPEPHTLAEIIRGRLLPGPDAQAVYLLHHGEHLHEIRADKWVGAGVAVLDGSDVRKQALRMHFVSPDLRNDWTFDLDVRVS